jgi:hypothetical protein
MIGARLREVDLHSQWHNNSTKQKMDAGGLTTAVCKNRLRLTGQEREAAGAEVVGSVAAAGR